MTHETSIATNAELAARTDTLAKLIIETNQRLKTLDGKLSHLHARGVNRDHDITHLHNKLEDLGRELDDHCDDHDVQP